jgi:carboxypeptidase C (cathepsin A)
MPVCAPSSTMATQISFATIWASRPWCALHVFSSPFFGLTPSLHAQIDTLDTLFSSLYAEQDFANYTVDGELAGLYKNAGTFSYLRVYGAGHEVPAYMWRDVPRGAAALQMFTQIMSDQPLSGT